MRTLSLLHDRCVRLWLEEKQLRYRAPRGVLRDNEHVLALGMDQIISDVSLKIMVRDLWTLYAQSVLGRCVALPRPTIRFLDSTAWQQGADAFWTRHHGAY